ncbi:MAG: hypothetical protein ABFS46_12445, partial [Myxococcota bacterium]
PLLQPEGVAACARALRERGPRLLLETHGLAHQALPAVLDCVDVVSMDWKLASDVRRAKDPRRGVVEPFHDAHERFLEVACGAPELVVKLVITPASRDDEIDEAMTRLARRAPRATVVLQPVTPRPGAPERPSAERLLELAARLGSRLSDVRVIPQTHPVYGAP